MTTTITLEEFQDHQEGQDGFCPACQQWTDDAVSCEDEEGLECPCCEEGLLMSAEAARHCGELEVLDEEVGS